MSGLLKNVYQPVHNKMLFLKEHGKINVNIRENEIKKDDCPIYLSALNYLYRLSSFRRWRKTLPMYCLCILFKILTNRCFLC